MSSSSCIPSAALVSMLTHLLLTYSSCVMGPLLGLSSRAGSSARSPSLPSPAVSGVWLGASSAETSRRALHWTPTKISLMIVASVATAPLFSLNEAANRLNWRLSCRKPRSQVCFRAFLAGGASGAKWCSAAEALGYSCGRGCLKPSSVNTKYSSSTPGGKALEPKASTFLGTAIWTSPSWSQIPFGSHASCSGMHSLWDVDEVWTA
mmetsp:Transcript_67407/g.189984  ORF Transcript_67407/g.189984 Transcript_67407/m.189984 type:complete len:207 (+) Transcript_67407:410-1030(+)